MFGLAVLLSLAAGTLLMGGCGPVDQKTLDLLPADKALQLKTWSTNHAIVFDLRIHSMDTCPFLTYLPNTGLQGQEWADFCWKFYGAKHREEDHCTCDADIAGGEPAPGGSPGK
jgi:hypothetical protein